MERARPCSDPRFSLQPAPLTGSERSSTSKHTPRPLTRPTVPGCFRHPARHGMGFGGGSNSPSSQHSHDFRLRVPVRPGPVHGLGEILAPFQLSTGMPNPCCARLIHTCTTCERRARQALALLFSHFISFAPPPRNNHLDSSATAGQRIAQGITQLHACYRVAEVCCECENRDDATAQGSSYLRLERLMLEPVPFAYCAGPPRDPQGAMLPPQPRRQPTC
jgi:hypothetical protein